MSCCIGGICRVLAHLGVKLKPNTCFGLVSGRHTFFLASDTPEEVRGWAVQIPLTLRGCTAASASQFLP